MAGKGWDHILAAVEKCLSGAKIRSYKEKYGTLRIDFNDVNDYTNALEDLAEEISEVTCESCGNLGIMRQVRGWWKVRCEPCLLEEQSSYEKDNKDIQQ